MKTVDYYEKLQCSNLNNMPPCFIYDKENKCYRYTICSNVKDLINLENVCYCVISIYKNGDFKFHFYIMNELRPWLFTEFYEENLTPQQKFVQNKFIEIVDKLINDGFLKENVNERF